MATIYMGPNTCMPKRIQQKKKKKHALDQIKWLKPQLDSEISKHEVTWLQI